MSAPVIRAKFKLNRVEQSLLGVAKKDSNGHHVKDEHGSYAYEDKEVHTIVANPVYGNGDPNHENSKFWAASPGGELRLTCVNADVVARLKLGMEFYLDFTPAE